VPLDERGLERTYKSVWWILGFPVFLMVLLVALAKLESRFLTPDEHTFAIRGLLASGTADEVEGQVTNLLAPVVDRPRRRPTRMLSARDQRFPRSA
jgi:hypothetical protein